MTDKKAKSQDEYGKQMEDRLREIEARFSAFMSHMPAAAWIKDLQGRYVYANVEAERVFSTPLYALLGKTDFDVFPEETARRFVENDQRALAEGGSLETTEVLVQADGIEHYSIVNKFAIFGDTRKAVAVGGIAFDITDRKHVEEALRAREERLRLAQQAARIGAFEWDIQSGLNKWTPQLEALYGLPEGGFAGTQKAWERLVHPDDWTTVKALVERTLETGDPMEGEWRITWPDRSIHWIAGRAQVFFDDAGRPKRMVGINLDITERKQVEVSLRKSQELSDALNRINSLIFSTLDFDEIMRRVLKESAAATGAEAGAIYMPVDGSWVARFSYGPTNLEGKHFTEQEVQYSIAAVNEKKVIRFNNLSGKEEICGFVTAEYGVKAVLDAPLVGSKKIIGDFALYSCAPGEVFSKEDEEFLRKVSASVALAVENAWLFTSLRESEERFRAVADNIAQFAWIADEKGKILWYNKRWYDYTGATSEEMEHSGWQQLVHPHYLKRVVEKINRSIESGESWEDTFPLQGNEDQYRWFLSRAIPIRDREGAVTRWFGTGTDITERREIEEEMKQIAHHDALTGLPNRRLFIEIINVEREQARRHRKNMAILFVDLDRFKEVNDTLGHEVGDELLKETAFRLKSVVRSSDTVARIGGDEFNILLTDLNRPEDTADIARNIIASFRQPFRLNEQEMNITTSVGISVYPDDSDEIDTLLRFADIAMYHAKGLGRNQYQFYNRAINVKSLESFKFENMLRQSLEKGEMMLYYQPQIDIHSRKITCAEALLRWNHPEKGIIEPDEFIPLAEENGFINALDAWAVKAACTQIKKWHSEGLPPICVTVNLASRCLQSPNEVELIAEILRDTGVDARYLDLEITETTAMGKIERTAPTLSRLSGMGIGISIDDFGTGYSSLNYLKKLPVKRIKIDKSFVKDIPQDAQDRAIFSAVTAMAHTMKMTVVAEGVETKAQLDFVSKTGCDEVQGFVFSKPLPPEEFSKLLKAA